MSVKDSNEYEDVLNMPYNEPRMMRVQLMLLAEISERMRQLVDVNREQQQFSESFLDWNVESLQVQQEGTV